MFAMFEPITLPSAMSPWPRSPALMPTTSSGAEVPSATTVRPPISGATTNH